MVVLVKPYRITSYNVCYTKLLRYSIGSNASSGGELGEFDISSFSDEIKKALEGVGKGQYTKPVDMGDSFQILYVADIISQGQGPVQEEVEKQIQDILYREHGEAHVITSYSIHYTKLYE